MEQEREKKNHAYNFPWSGIKTHSETLKHSGSTLSTWDCKFNNNPGEKSKLCKVQIQNVKLKYY